MPTTKVETDNSISQFIFLVDSPVKSFDDFVPFHIFSSETRRNTNEIQCEFTNTGMIILYLLLLNNHREIQLCVIGSMCYLADDELLELENVKQLTIRWKNNCKDVQYVAVRSIPIVSCHL